VAGMAIATGLGNRLGRSGRAEITLIDKSLTHVWKQMLHCFAAGTAQNESNRISSLLQASRHGFRFWPGEIERLDRARRRGRSQRLADLARWQDPGRRAMGWPARLGHLLLYRQHQMGLYGFVLGCIAYCAEWLSSVVRPRVRLD
jgi:hypothetical protein